MPMSAAPGIALDEPLIFERGAPGRTGASVPAMDVPAADPKALFGEAYREEAPRLPEVSEPEVFRHYVRLSQQNFAIDSVMYPLGSCTMKYNPKVNEHTARLSGFAHLHPYSPERMMQGALELMYRLERGLAEICGMDRVTLQPAAGAQGELTGLMMIRAWHEKQGRSPRKVLIPETAHGTNPASCALNGLTAVPFPAGEDGVVHAEQLAPHVTDDVAAIMITNPNTVGLFERELPQIAKMLHDKGALVYGDGANLNALMGRARPGDLGIDVMQFNLHKTFTTPHGGGGPGTGPVGVKAHLAEFLPSPVVARSDDGTFRLDHDVPRSIGRMRSFYGNFGNLVRAYTYIRALGREGLREVSGYAVLNANYLRVKLKELGFTVPFDRVNMHEFVAQPPAGLRTLDIAKAQLDYGMHPATVYFPLIVKEALMVEPTETESLESLDAYVEALAEILARAAQDPAFLSGAPYHTPVRRLDEVRAARQPVLKYGFPAE